MPLPNAIQIGPIRYAVTNDKAAYNECAASSQVSFWGHIGYSDTTIVLAPDQTPDHMRWALMHEILHGCWHVAEPDGTTFTEEQAIRTLTGSLLDTLRRNPDLVAFLLEAE